jgi:F-type H+-transporting ATPase subunit delta
MPNPRLSSRYAKSLIDLAIERNQLELVYADMQYLQGVCNVSKEFVNLLKSPIVKADKKQAVLDALTKGKVSDLTASFTKLLVTKGRESDLPEITSAVVDQYNTIKGIHKVKLTTAVEISDEVKKAITAKTNTEAGLGKIELETKTDASLIGGFKLEFNNNLVDASIARDLREVRKQFDKNVYVRNIR